MKEEAHEEGDRGVRKTRRRCGKAATARREAQVDDLGSDCSSETRDEPGDLGLGGARAHRFETEESIDRFLAAGPARPPRIVDVAARPRSVERPQPLRGSFERYDGGALQSRRSYERRSRSPPRTYERRSRSPPRLERRSRSPRVSHRSRPSRTSRTSMMPRVTATSASPTSATIASESLKSARRRRISARPNVWNG